VPINPIIRTRTRHFLKPIFFFIKGIHETILEWLFSFFYYFLKEVFKVLSFIRCFWTRTSVLRIYVLRDSVQCIVILILNQPLKWCLSLGSWSLRVQRTTVCVPLRLRIIRQIHEEGTAYFSKLPLLTPIKLSLFSFPEIIKKFKELRWDFFASKCITDYVQFAVLLVLCQNSEGVISIPVYFPKFWELFQLPCRSFVTKETVKHFI
jgi:hypothetical protein